MGSQAEPGNQENLDKQAKIHQNAWLSASRLYEPPKEQNGIRRIMSDKEQEGSISLENYLLRGHCGELSLQSPWQRRLRFLPH